MQVFDPIRKKPVAFTPEEHVRQLLLAHMMTDLNYPSSMIAVERALNGGARNYRYDLVVYSREHRPWMLAECKAPTQDIDPEVLFQLLRYHKQLPCRYWLLTNGRQSYCAEAVADGSEILWLEAMPEFTI
jgi:hypothetical protein